MFPVILIVVRVHISAPDKGPVHQSIGGWERAGQMCLWTQLDAGKITCLVNPEMISDPKY